MCGVTGAMWVTTSPAIRDEAQPRPRLCARVC